MSTVRDRQAGTTIDMIRSDHVARYLLAGSRLKGKKILDLACGCGYGSAILDKSGNDVTGVDIEPEAIAYAEEYYGGPKYLCQRAVDTSGTFDVIVSFETIEHIEHPNQILMIDAPMIFASVPNQEVVPFRAETFAGDEYPHLRHYTPQEFEDLLNGAGFTVAERFCQPTKKGQIESGTNGRTLIYIAHR